MAPGKKSEFIDLFMTLTDSSGGSGAGAGGAIKIKFAWKGNKVAYRDDVGKALGVTAAKDNEPGLIFGMNRPRPARVYVNVKVATGNNKSYLLFAGFANLGSLLIKNSLKGKKYRGGTITSVSLPKTSTSPTRKKAEDKTGTANRTTTPKRTTISPLKKRTR